jgi:hypothetical protein
VEEDESAGPQSDSRQALAKFNKQMEVLFKFLQAVENIKLDPSVLDPEPVEIADEKDGKIKTHAVSKGMPEGKYRDSPVSVVSISAVPNLVWFTNSTK